MIKLKQLREAGISAIELPCRIWNHEVMRTSCFFLKLKAIIVGLAFLKAGFNKKNPAQVLLTWLMQGKQTLLALTDLLLRNGKTKIFHFVTPSQTLSKKILCSFTGTGWLPSTLAVYKAPTYPTIIRCADFFGLGTLLASFFGIEAV